MTKVVKELSQCGQTSQPAPEMEDTPEYKRGREDGRLQTWISAPDMRNGGLNYACGWIAGRFCEPAMRHWKH